MGYIDGQHRRQCEDGFVRQARDWGLTHHVILTCGGPVGSKIVTAKRAAEVADTHARECCQGYVIGTGDQQPYGGSPHVHVLANATDARLLRDAWYGAGLGHVETTTDHGDPDDFRRRTLYVFRKLALDAGGHRGLVYVTPGLPEQPGECA